jgi:hypothetical protein
MTRKHIKIQKSVDSILEIVDNLKETIKDGDYKKILDKLKVINDNNEEEKKSKLYIINIMLVTINKTTDYHCIDENDPDDCFYSNFDYQPVIKTIKRKVKMTQRDCNIIQQRLEGSIAGIRWIHGISDSNPVEDILNSLSDYNEPTMYETTKIKALDIDKNITINTKLLKTVRLLSIEECCV